MNCDIIVVGNIENNGLLFEYCLCTVSDYDEA